VHAWVTSPGANNTVRQRYSTARTFLRWCHRHGLIPTDPTVELDYLTKQYPKTYGRVQAPTPARWLTHHEAFGKLIDQCHDNTIVGLRDEIVILLGLTGMRRAEVRNLRIADIGGNTITWIGKGRVPRRIVPGRRLADAIAEYLATWTRETGSPQPDDHLVCPASSSAARWGTHTLMWGTPPGYCLVGKIVTTRAEAAGLGHVAPHDLRRSAAGILHHAMSADGGHRFDLLDVQRVLGHADPATTMRSYLDPVDTDVLDRAATVLDVPASP
jgi:integrase